MERPWVGRSVPRREGRDKLTGSTVYVDDVHVDGMLHGATVRSPVARGRLSDIVFEPGVPWDEIVVVTAKDVPGENAVVLLQRDQPILADAVVNHCDEPVVLLAHPDRGVVEEARRHVRLDIEPLPAVYDIDAALAGTTVIWGEDNVFTEYRSNKGDVDTVWDRAHLIVQGEYETGAQEQMYIEPQGMIAEISEGGIVVRGSLQCPYYVQTALAPVFGLPPEKIRVIQTATGGGFGGKEEYPSIIAGHAALLAWKAGRPVKVVYDRIEDVAATTKRHPSRTRHRTAVDRDGHLLAMEIDFVIDGGAYVTLSPVVLSRGTIHAAGPYRCDNVRVRSRAVATNAPPHGAFRGFGAPQSIFALERHLDRIAERLQLDPLELRRRNLLRTGETTAVQQVIHEPIDLDALVDRALAESDYVAKRERFTRHNAETTGPTRKGIGLSVFFHGAGFTGSGEVRLASVADVEATHDGRVRVLAASTEIGQGTTTVFSQIVAEAASIDIEKVEIVQPDTQAVPDSGPTVASRTCMVVGDLVMRATRDLVSKLRGADLLGEHWDDEAFALACGHYIDRHGALRGHAKYEPPPGLHWDDQGFRGDAYARYAWAVYVAEVTVDMRTCEVQVDDFVAVQEIGRTVNPVLASGQIQGGVAQAIGWALYEQVVWRDGAVANPQMTNYIIPTAPDTPPIRVVFFAPFEGDEAKAKGIGELPMDGPAPAVLAAVEQATGARVDAIPMLPEHLLDALTTRSEDEDRAAE
jgi:CO/xanthine dehydrogenase Mo-binding subunit